MKKTKVEIFLYKMYIYILSSLVFLSPINKKNIENYNIIIKNCNDEDILDKNMLLIIDERHTEDPNIKIKDSHKIENIFLMKSIIDFIKAYDKYEPTDWNRSDLSMVNEWIIHNILYDFNIERDRTKSVDFNNGDEHVYTLFKHLP